MKRFIVLGLICIMVVAMFLASCSTTSVSTTQTASQTVTQTSAQTTTSKTPVVTTPTAVSTTTVVTTSVGNWWDSLGKPQYGGTIVIRTPNTVANFDPINPSGLFNVEGGYMEHLHTDDWTINPSIYAYQTDWRPSDYIKGNLAASFEFSDVSTYVVHLRQGIHYQNIPPANGREFTSADVVYNFDRLYGLGDGFTKPAPAQTGAPWNALTSVTAIDKYTVAFKWNVTCPELILESMQANANTQYMECPEAVQQWGDLTDWHHAIGTGPFILQDYVGASSVTLVKNPNYWAYDERYPQNQLPYVDGIKILTIPDTSTALAAMRTGKIDFMDNVNINDSQAMKKTNPDIVQTTLPLSNGVTIDPNDTKAPFNDIRVREAMQMALDLPTIASSYYLGSAPSTPVSMTSLYEAGWGFPYTQWPQDLKDQYAYNPTKAKQLLTDAGYPNGFTTTDVVDVAADINLINIIQSYFAAIGITMNVQQMDSASYSSWLNGLKNTQLTQKSIGIQGVTTEPTRQLQRYNSTYPSNICHVNDPVFDAFYPTALAATTLDGVKAVVKQMNQYVAQQHFSISLLQPSYFALNQPWLKGYSGQTRSLGCGSAGDGIHLLFFYGSRFWIDKSLKK